MKNELIKYSVPLKVDVPTGLADGRWPVTLGVPFPEGAIPPHSPMSVVLGNPSSGAAIPAQIRPICTWDLSPVSGLRWVHVDFQVNVKKGEAEGPLWLVPGREPLGPPQPATWHPEGDEGWESILVGTGVAGFRIRCKGTWGIEEWLLHDQPQLEAGAPARFYLLKDGVRFDAVGYGVRLESVGPMRVSVNCSGWFHDTEGQASPFCRFFLRIDAFAGLPSLRIMPTFIFTGDSKDDQLHDLALEFPVGTTASVARFGVDESNLSEHETKNAVASCWLHHDRPKRDTPETILELGQEKKVSSVLPPGWMDVQNGDFGMTFALRDGWQGYPFELGLDQDGIARVHLWPSKGRILDLSKDAVVARFGAAELAQLDPGISTKIEDHEAPATGLARTHEIWVHPWRGEFDSARSASAALAASHPVIAHADPVAACASDAMGRIAPRDRARFPKVEAMLDGMFALYESWTEKFNDYGWYDYLDVHDQVLEELPKSAVGGSMADLKRYWASTHYGFPNVPWLLYVRSGDRRFLEFAEANSRHCMDIDRCHHDDAATGSIKATSFEVDGSLVHWIHPKVGLNYLQLEYLLYGYYLRGYVRPVEVIHDWAKRVLDPPPGNEWLFNVVQPVVFEQARHHGPPLGNLVEWYRALLRIPPESAEPGGGLSIPNGPLDVPDITPQFPPPVVLGPDSLQEAQEQYREEVGERAREVARVLIEDFDPVDQIADLYEFRVLECFANKLRWCWDGIDNYLRWTNDPPFRTAVTKVARMSAHYGADLHFGAEVLAWRTAEDSEEGLDALSAGFARLMQLVCTVNFSQAAMDTFFLPPGEVSPVGGHSPEPESPEPEPGHGARLETVDYPYLIRSIPWLLRAIDDADEDWRNEHLPVDLMQLQVPANAPAEIRKEPGLFPRNVSCQAAGPVLPSIYLYPGPDARVVFRLGHFVAVRFGEPDFDLLRFRKHIQGRVAGQNESQEGCEFQWADLHPMFGHCSLTEEQLAAEGAELAWVHNQDLTEDEAKQEERSTLGLVALDHTDLAAGFSIHYQDAVKLVFPLAPTRREGLEYMDRGNLDLVRVRDCKLLLGPSTEDGRYCLFGPRFYFRIPDAAVKFTVQVRFPALWGGYGWKPHVQLRWHPTGRGEVSWMVEEFETAMKYPGDSELPKLVDWVFSLDASDFPTDKEGFWSIGPMGRARTPWQNAPWLNPPRCPEEHYPQWFRVFWNDSIGATAFFPFVTTRPDLWFDLDILNMASMGLVSMD